MTNPWDDLADRWDDMGGPARYSTLAFGTLEPLLVDLKRSARVLDLGAGTGLMSEKLSRNFDCTVAIDTSQKMVEALRKKALPGVEVRHTGIEGVPEDFDLVVASSVCAFIPQFDQAIFEIAERLRPGCCFVQWDWQKRSDGDGGPGFSKDKLTLIYKATGLDIVDVRTAFHFSDEDEGLDADVLMGVLRRPA